jgi:hypothetical protein
MYTLDFRASIKGEPGTGDWAKNSVAAAPIKSRSTIILVTRKFDTGHHRTVPEALTA